MNTSSQIVYEERNSNVGLGETIRFRLPNNIMLLNTQESYLRFNFVVGTKGKQAGFVSGDEADEAHYLPWTFGEGGAYNLIKNLVIRDYTSGITLETIEGYNLLNRVLVNYTKNESEKNLDRLYCGADNEKVRAVNTLTRRTVAGTGASTAGETQENMEIEVILPLKLSGILNNAQPYPNALAPLEVEILLEDEVYKVLHVQGQQLGGEAANFEDNKDVQNEVAGYQNDTITYCVDGTPNGAQTTVEILRTTNAGNDNIFTGDLVASETPNFPFFNGQACIIETSSGDEEIVINNIALDGQRLQLTFDSVTFTNVTAFPKIYVKVPDSRPTCTLSELQLVCGVVTPEANQMTAIESAVKSGQGYGYAYKSFQDFPVNNNANALQVSNLINCRLRMCKAILCFWENVGGVYKVQQDNLLPDLDSSVAPKSYQFKYHGLLTPARTVDLARYNRTRNQPGAWGAVHIKELEQALGCCGYPVKDLSNVDGCLMFGRGLVPVKSSYVDNLDDNEETRLNIKYSAQGQSLLQHNYVCHNKTFVIKSSGKMVEE